MGVTTLQVRMNSKKKFVDDQKEEFYRMIEDMLWGKEEEDSGVSLTEDETTRLEYIFQDTKHNMDGIIIAFQAIRNCYSPLETKEILKEEFKKYFLSPASKKDESLGGENDAQRLINFIFKSSHTSTLEHLHFTFHIEGASRALLAQLTRHRHWSFSVKSQRYVKFSSESKSQGMDYIVPPTIIERGKEKEYHQFMQDSQEMYDFLIEAKVPQEDARFVLPNSATTTIVASLNLASALDFYKKRKPKSGAQWEIAQLALEVRNCIVKEEPWTEHFFNQIDKQTAKQ